MIEMGYCINSIDRQQCAEDTLMIMNQYYLQTIIKCLIQNVCVNSDMFTMYEIVVTDNDVLRILLYMK